jgi:hypothetical protein
MRLAAGKTLLILLMALLPLTLSGQFKSAFSHYSVEDGLSEGVVLTMHQDREGLSGSAPSTASTVLMAIISKSTSRGQLKLRTDKQQGGSDHGG